MLVHKSKTKMFFKKFQSVLSGIKIFIIFHFAIVNRTISNNYGTKYPFLIDIATSVITIYFILFSTIVLSVCASYKALIFMYLLVRHGKHFHGMITGMNLLTTLAPGCDGSVHGLTRCSTEKVFNPWEVYAQICTHIEKKFYLTQVNGKFFSTREYTIFGYHYFKETFGVKVEDIVKTIQAPNKKITDTINEDELMELATTYYNSDLPVNNKFNWDICLCLNPLETSNNTTKFVFFHRMHHSLGDGLVIYNILVNNLFKTGPDFKEYSENLVNKCKQLEKTKSEKTGAHVYKFGHKILIEKPCILRDGARHINTIFTTKVEEPSSITALDKVQAIRKKYPGVPTFNIFMTAYSASLAEYYLKYTEKLKDVPESFQATQPVQLDVSRFQNIFSASDRIELKNEMSSFQFKCPVVPRSKQGVPIREYLVDRMLTIKEDVDKSFASMDIQAEYLWMATYFDVFPYQITRNLFHGIFMTTLTTCMPGGPKLKLFNDDNITDITYFLPRQYYATLALTINTYDRRLQIGLTANRDKVNYKKLNEIRDGIFKYLDILYENCK